MNGDELPRFDELVSRHLDDALTETETAGLLALLAEPTLAARFLETMRLDSEIAGLLAAPVPDAAMVALVRANIDKSRAAGQTSLPARRKPARWALAWAAVFLALAGLAAVFLFKGARRAETPAITSVQGEVRVLGPAGARALEPGHSWQRGETLQTVGARSAATVMFDDGTRLDFGGGSVAVNQSGVEGRRVELERGEVKGMVKKQPARQAFVFVTPAAEAVVAGTMLQVTIVDADHTRVLVTEGLVLVKRRSDSAEIPVRAGFHVLVGPKSKLTAGPNDPGQRPR